MLTFFFRDHIERRFDGELKDHLEELVAASEVSSNGSFVLCWRLFDPRFNRPRSGWYWQVRQNDETVVRSDSLSQTELSIGPARDSQGALRELAGPSGEALRAVDQSIVLPRSQATFVYTVAGPVADIDADVSHFVRKISLTMTMLATGLLAAVFFQLRFGLRPLDVLRQALTSVRCGRSERLDGEFPKEVRPLVDELNGLLERNAEMLARARAHAADLAHALENPLTVINESKSLEGPAAPVHGRSALGRRPRALR